METLRDIDMGVEDGTGKEIGSRRNTITPADSGQPALVKKQSRLDVRKFSFSQRTSSIYEGDDLLQMRKGRQWGL